MTALRDAPGCDPVLPFVLQFYGRRSMYFWEHDFGEVHDILQGEGGEQGDALMPTLFALGQDKVLDAIQKNLRLDEKLLAFAHGHIAQPH